MANILPTKFHFENNLFSPADIEVLLGHPVEVLANVRVRENELSVDAIRSAMTGDEDITLKFNSAEEYWSCEVWNGDGCTGLGDSSEAGLALLAAYADYKLQLASDDEVLPALSRELNSFIDLHGYETLSADELLSELVDLPDAPDCHRAWLEDFIERWDAANQ
ncbi:MAG: hypothetical protein ACFHHU_00630 [Porticoccaceae bacterium]